eukprot:5313410-Pleurochrysis_carterae.AAC.3
MLAADSCSSLDGLCIELLMNAVLAVKARLQIMAGPCFCGERFSLNKMRGCADSCTKWLNAVATHTMHQWGVIVADRSCLHAGHPVLLPGPMLLRASATAGRMPDALADGDAGDKH